MKIAIMGAGLSGLSCALTLEQNGVIPDIFENRRQVGDSFVNGEILLEALYRPVNDSIAFLAENYHIFLQPSSNIRRLVLISASKRAVIEGHLGYVTIRGRHQHSLEAQLARQVSAGIIFNSQSAYENFAREYSHVVIATGDGAYAQKLQNYDLALSASLRGATFTGDFEES